MAERHKSDADNDSLDGPLDPTPTDERDQPVPTHYRMAVASIPHPILAQVAAEDDIDNLSNNLSDLSFNSKDSGIGSYVSGNSVGRVVEPIRHIEPGSDSTALERKHIDDLIRYGHRKLGYSEDEVIEVIKRRGTAITRNQLMEGLTQIGQRPAHRESVTRVSWQESRQADTSADDCRTESNHTEGGKSDIGSTGQPTDNNLRTIVIDGSNVAMAHGNNTEYSCRGIKIAADYFKERGHEKIIVFVPHDKFKSHKVKDQHVLKDLRKQNIIVKTPSKKLEQRKITPYDDRFILQLATKEEGVVVSNDSFKDLLREGKSYQETILKRVLPYSFHQDDFIPAEDPLGRRGPPLDQFLRRRPLDVESNTCPYGRKCTYGNKCKYNHPERDPLGTSLSNNSDEGFLTNRSDSDNSRHSLMSSQGHSSAESGAIDTPYTASLPTSPSCPHKQFHSLPENLHSNRAHQSPHSLSAGSANRDQTHTQPTHIHSRARQSQSPPASKVTARSNEHSQSTERIIPLRASTRNTELINPTLERLTLQENLATTFQPALVLKVLNENPRISSQQDILPLLISNLSPTAR